MLKINFLFCNWTLLSCFYVRVCSTFLLWPQSFLVFYQPNLQKLETETSLSLSLSLSLSVSLSLCLSVSLSLSLSISLSLSLCQSVYLWLPLSPYLVRLSSAGKKKCIFTFLPVALFLALLTILSVCVFIHVTSSWIYADSFFIMFCWKNVKVFCIW